MGRRFEYTTLAHRYTARFPVLTYVGTQTNFWIVSNVLLVTITHLQSLIISETYALPLPGGFGTMMLIALGLGVVYGVILGLSGYYLDKFLRKQALGKVIVIKTMISLGLLIATLALVRNVFFDPFIAPSLPASGTHIALQKSSWRMLFFLLVVYYSFMTLIINFINQVNKKYGPGILLPLLLGRFREPKEEVRIFMFMDLKSSTATAERLGHLKYSAFIRDCFSDINEALFPFRAQVYQYVGDEIVVSWPESEGLKNHFCIEFYFACKRQFRDRVEYYTTQYGFLPDFKAGAHMGPVTIVEIGEIKRDIAYHGDTLNTAARIQSVCNDYQQSFIASKTLIDKTGTHPSMKTQDLGMILLKGKTTKVGLVSVEWVD